MIAERKTFFDLYRSDLDPDRKLTQKEVNAIDFFISKVNENWCQLPMLEQWAYVLATVFHETKYTFEPVVEAFWLSENWRSRNLRYYPYHGRGFVQLTWGFNYAHYSKVLDIDLLKHPEKAQEPEVAFFILLDGMKNGVYTGRRLSQYINENEVDYVGARKIVNGTDDDDLIASYARLFEKILRKSR